MLSLSKPGAGIWSKLFYLTQGKQKHDYEKCWKNDLQQAESLKFTYLEDTSNSAIICSILNPFFLGITSICSSWDHWLRVTKKMSHAHYPSSHNHGSEKWVPPIVATFQIQPFSTFRIMGERVPAISLPGLKPKELVHVQGHNKLLPTLGWGMIHILQDHGAFLNKWSTADMAGILDKSPKWWCKFGLELCIQ